MVWFSCNSCNDTIKKPKLQQHIQQCGSWSFNCVDCCQAFDRQGAQAHSMCMTEHQKYALGATKPGGTHAGPQQQQGGGQQGQQQQQQPGEPSGLEFLSARPPWKCSICNVVCTSKETLLSHGAGIKHKRRARAALAAQNGGADAAAAAAATNGGAAAPNGSAAGGGGGAAVGAAEEAAGAQPEEVKEEAAVPPKSSKKKKRKAEQEAAAEAATEVAAPEAEPGGEEEGIKKKKKQEKKKQGHPALQDEAAAAKLRAALLKKLREGSLGPKKQRKLVAKRLGLEGPEGVDEALLGAVRAQLLALGQVELEGEFLTLRSG